MSDFERETRVVRDDPAYVERTTTVTDTPGETVYVERGSSAGPWIIAAIVAVIAIMAVLFLMNNRDEPVDNAEDIAAALDASRAAGYIEGATTTMSQIPPTQTVPVPVPVPSYDSGAADRSAAEAAASADAARRAAERAADSAANTSPDTSVSSNTTP